MNETLYFETGSNDPNYNLAFEEYLLLNHKEGDLLMLWQNDNTIVCGVHQNVEEEINRAYVDEHGVNVVRRTTGGGAVYHDMGNLNYSFITDVGEASEMSIQSFTVPVVKALAAMGVTAEANGKNDIVVEGCKVSGTAQRIAGNRILHHGTLLFDSDISKVAGALKPKEEKFQSKSTKSVRSRVGNIRSFLPKDLTLNEFWNILKKELSEGGIREERLCDAELVEVEKLAKEKYRTYEWVYGRSPAYTLKGHRRTDGGTIEAYADIKEGKIAHIQVFGDFMARKNVADIEDALVGCAFRKADVSEILSQFVLTDYLGGVTEADLLDVLFD